MSLRLLLIACFGMVAIGQADSSFDRDKLVAWCIVPFDAKQRGPAARVEMLNQLGLKRVAYDWRAKHVAEFEEEVLQYKTTSNFLPFGAPARRFDCLKTQHSTADLANGLQSDQPGTANQDRCRRAGTPPARGTNTQTGMQTGPLQPRRVEENRRISSLFANHSANTTRPTMWASSITFITGTTKSQNSSSR